MVEYDPELIERPTARLIPLVPVVNQSIEQVGPEWEERMARIGALLAHDGDLRGPFTLWVTGQLDAILISPRHLAPPLAKVLDLEPLSPIPFPRDGRPILHCRPDGSLVRLWAKVPTDRDPLEVITFNSRRWRWENRRYWLID